MTVITNTTHGYMSRSLEQAWKTILYSWARFIGWYHDPHTDADDLRSGSFLQHDDFGSKFVVLRFGVVLSLGFACCTRCGVRIRVYYV